jgi:RNA polymerase sigma-70 factor, ECF subfamily
VDQCERAIEGVYRSRYLRFRAVLTTLTGDRETARDAVQEGFARALAHRSDFRGDPDAEGSLEAWIWRITLRSALERRQNGSGIPIGELFDPVLPSSSGESPLADALRRLPPRRRFITFLRYFADLSYAEIAEICGISEGTVAAALAPARTTLRGDLNDSAVLEDVPSRSRV